MLACGDSDRSIDANPIVFLPRAGLIVPGGLVPGTSVTARGASVSPSPSRD